MKTLMTAVAAAALVTTTSLAFAQADQTKKPSQEQSMKTAPTGSVTKPATTGSSQSDTSKPGKDKTAPGNQSSPAVTERGGN
jgi:hypothetical protein